jgi:hypothetical protein
MVVVATSVSAQEPERRAPRQWLGRVRLSPTLTTTAGTQRSGGGFGLQLGAEWGTNDGWFALPLALELAGDDRQEINCVLGCRSGRMSAWMVTSGVILRPVQVWRLRPYVEGTVSGGLVQWSNAVLPAGFGGVGIAAGGQVGGGFVSRVSTGAGVELAYGERWITLGVQRGTVREARWPAVREVTTVVLGVRSQF